MKNRLIGLSFLLAGMASAASGNIISGTVVDTLNDSIANATVTLKSGGADTFTNVSGQFNLFVNSTATIIR
jgi:hypothetical protein